MARRIRRGAGVKPFHRKRNPMRVVTITKKEFDGVLYVALTGVPSENEDELMTTVAIKQRLRPHITMKDLTPEEVRVDKTPGWELTEIAATIVFEEDEHKLLLKRLKMAIPIFTGHVAEMVLGIRDKLVNAEKQEPGVGLVDDEGVRRVDMTPTKPESVETKYSDEPVCGDF